MKRAGSHTRGLILALTLLLSLMTFGRAEAQHTLTLVGGSGATYGRFYPAEEVKWLWGANSFGLAWRYYSDKPRFVGAVGVDLEYMERGFKLGYTYTSDFVNEKEVRHYQYYTRNVNSVMLPIVWQPHFYLAKNRLRVFIEAAFVLSFNINSNYSYENDRYPGGKYEWKLPRDNRFGYGLMGGAGFAVLLGQVEVGLKARYNFGYSDLMKNRNKYYSSSTDGRENPFYYSPLRSPIDNLTFSLTVGWRFNKRGFDEWFVKRPQRTKRLDSFNFSQATNAAAGAGRGTSGSSGSSTRPSSSSNSQSRQGMSSASQTRPTGGQTTRPGGATSATRPGGQGGVSRPPVR